ncbi:MAG: transposase [Patescibacteria group bacterium]|nr:transposase [Patescibacteria group bacterium]
MEHIDGVGFRRLGDENILSGPQTYACVIVEMEQLPKNDWLTKELCDLARCQGILILDGKYVAVKGFERKIPFLFGIDYLSHDILHGELYLAEDEVAFSQYFQRLKDLGYRLRIVVADDRAGLKQALNKVFPYARLQLCQNHYLENIRNVLKIRSLPTYQHFFNSLKLHVFTAYETDEEITEGLKHVRENHAGKNFLLHNILADIENRRNELFAYRYFENCPNNTNLIELYNSHLAGRLKTIKGFQSLASARRWLNAWLVRRRTKKFTDCDVKFKTLNRHCSLELTIKKQAHWPEQLTKLGIKKIKFYEKIDENIH